MYIHAETPAWQQIIQEFATGYQTKSEAKLAAAQAALAKAQAEGEKAAQWGMIELKKIQAKKWIPLAIFATLGIVFLGMGGRKLLRRR